MYLLTRLKTVLGCYPSRLFLISGCIVVFKRSVEKSGCWSICCFFVPALSFALGVATLQSQILQSRYCSLLGLSRMGLIKMNNKRKGKSPPIQTLYCTLFLNSLILPITATIPTSAAVTPTSATGNSGTTLAPVTSIVCTLWVYETVIMASAPAPLTL